MDIVLVTRNAHKIYEMNALINSKLDGKKINLLSLKDVGFDEEIEETGTTFEENAKIKAVTAFRKLKMPCIADDSGICVDYLNGAPGVYSARYAPTDEECIDKLLAALEGVPAEKRGAHYGCAIYFIMEKNGEESIISVNGECHGTILTARAGANGFGYDPIFFYEPESKTFAQLTLEEKNKYSHRAIAVEQFAKKIVELV